MNVAKDLTILLTLKDRPSFTFRWMAYANTLNFPFKILIADGGADEAVPNTLLNKARYPNLEYQYVRYPYDQTFVEYHAKMADVLARVETPFVVLADNDDFYIAGGLQQSVRFLQKHPDYIACRGRVGLLRVHESESYGDLSGVYGDTTDFVPELYLNDSLDQETARERFQSHFPKYSSTWYEVHRTVQLREAFRVLRSLEISDLYLAELLISGLTVAAGKVRREPYPYLLRQINTPDSEATRKSDPLDRMLLETWSGDFKKCVDAMADALAAQDQMPIDDARGYVKQLYREYIGPFVVYWTQRNSNMPAPTRGNRGLLRTTKRGLRKLHSFANELTNTRPGKNSPDGEEFRAIREFLASAPADAPVVSFHAKR